MCSSAATEAAPARCLLCSVGCPVRVMKAGPDRYLPDYVPHAGYAGLCGRGSVLADLLDHPARLFQAHRHAAGGRCVLALKDAAREAAEALRAAGEGGAIFADGNFDCDALAAVGGLAAASGAGWSVSVEGGDAGLVHALDSSGCQFAGPEDLAEAGALLIVGNVFASHPVAAHWIFEARSRRPRMSVLVMADASGITTQFATAVYQVRLGVGETARALAAVASGRTEALGPGAAILAGWKEELKKAENPAIVVTADLGYADARALGDAVAALAKDAGARICPLTAYGNAWGALRAGAAAGAGCPMQLLKGRPRTLLVIGRDLVAALGARAAGPVLDAVEELIYVGPMPSATSRRANLVIPAAFPFEAAGRVLLGPGREVRYGPLLSPPAGVPALAEVLAMMGAPAGPAADLSGPAPPGPAVPSEPTPEPADGQVILGPAADPIDFADGSLTRATSWPQKVRPRPVVLMSARDAEAAGLVEAAVALVTGPGGSARCEVRVSEAQRPGQARTSAAFAEVRDLFGWTTDGRAIGDPVPVTISKAQPGG